MASVQHLEVYAGENRTLTLAGRDASNAVVSLSGKTVTVYVGRRPNDPENSNAIFSKIGTIVSAPDGMFSIAIVPDDTQDLQGDYQYQAKTTDGSGLVAVVARGRFRVLPTIESP